jgi:drug/metabolite transporter (DMT)-like permease
VFLRERLTARQGIGIGLAVLGLAAIAASRAQSAAVLPVLLTLCGALGWAFGNLCNRLAAPPKPMHLTLWMCVVPVVPLFAASALVEGNGWTSVPTLFTAEGLPGLGALLYVALLATVVGSGIWTWLMRRYPAGVVAPYSLLVPVVGIALSAAVLGEQPSVVELGSAVLIVGGVLLGTPRAIRTEPDDVVGTEVEPARTRLSW